MKRLQHIYLFIFLAAVAMMVAACSKDDVDTAAILTDSGMARVTLRLATDAGHAVTRAEGQAVTRAWQDANAETDRSEMMYQWTVLITDGSTIKYKFTGTPAAAEAEIDNVCTDEEMAAGTYTVYSFANISEARLQALLGVANLDAGTALADAAVAAATATVNGNGFVPTAADANGFGCQGIPMSNRQTLTVPASGSVTKDLIVVRMLAKMQLQITNQTGAAVTVKKITLTDVTQNTADNLKLLPQLTYNDDMDAHHQDVRPNLNGTPATVDFDVVTTDQSIANGATHTVSFYVNESATPTTSEGLFQLLIELDGGEYRYSLISNNAQNEWNYIARNDYRILPVTLDDYHFELVPYDFPPIGVLPVSMKELDAGENLYEFTFHDYGHFHLVPRVTKGSGALATAVPFGSPEGTADSWTLAATTPASAPSWAASWLTAAAKGGTRLTDAEVTATGFYRNQTATADGDEAGGAPQWYLNDGTAGPQWKPTDADSYQPFVFGYIAEPDDAWWAAPTDKQIYHEMRLRLYVGGSYRRDMVCRFYMTLSASQMLASRAMHRSARQHRSLTH